MSAQTRPISFPPTSKSRSIRFSSTPTTNRPQPMSTRSITTHPISSAPIIVRRNTTACPAQLDTIDVKPRRLVGRAPPPAQFEIVTPPRSPSRLPQRTKSTNANVSGSRGGMGSTIPRRSPSAFDMADEQKFYAATMNSAVRRTQRTSQKVDRGPPRRPPLRPAFSPRLRPGSAVRAGTGCARADPSLPHYPRLTPSERDVLARKLRVLLKCIDVDSSALDGWDGDVLQDAGSNNSGRVFGTSIQDSSAYANCQVVLGDHTHSLPICAFASVEEICRRGITTPALFRFAPSPTERTLESLASAFEQPPYYGSRTSLAGEDISNICALLKLYLRALPEPVFSPTLWPILQQITSTPHSSDPEADDATRTAAFQALLHLHPPTSFSLLTYLLSFLHHLLTHSSQNNLTIPTLATLFGPALFSPRTQSTTGRGCMSVPSPNPSPKGKPEAKGPVVLVKSFLSAKEGEEGVRVLSWILERWEGVAVGLLDVDVVRDLDVGSWEAGFLSSVTVRARRSSDATESDSETAYSDNSRVGPDKQGEYKGFPFPESVLLEQVPVREVRDSMVIIEDVHMSTRGSSPTTLWSQETGKPLAYSTEVGN
ncbi:Rho GTPase activation protein [Ceratobasidium sp. AG-I]|nr:Rho GTPase activation protein [Ceratobasidium sp. AG-I]